jgi:hypothetical protein
MGFPKSRALEALVRSGNAIRGGQNAARLEYVVERSMVGRPPLGPRRSRGRIPTADGTNNRLVRLFLGAVPTHLHAGCFGKRRGSPYGKGSSSRANGSESPSAAGAIDQPFDAMKRR